MLYLATSYLVQFNFALVRRFAKRVAIEHIFATQGWLMFLSQKLGRTPKTVQKRLTNLKHLIERETKSDYPCGHR